MKNIQGKFATAKIFTDVIDDASVTQISTLLDQPFVQGSKVRMMPDVHAGTGCTIGTTMTIADKVCPNLVGVDIGCGMYTVAIQEKSINYQKLDSVIRNKIPYGQSVHSEIHPLSSFINLYDLFCVNFVNLDRAHKSIGTLGGGNHFIEIDKDSDGNLFLVVHTGSRHLGVEIAKFYQKAAVQALANSVNTKAIVKQLLAEGRQNEIEQTLIAAKAVQNVPKELAYLQDDLLRWYLHDMQIAQQFASLNRETIAETICQEMGLHCKDTFSTIHNYIDVENRILRKGAVSAAAGEKLLIPINMRDGSLVCVGKGNPDWNYSAPHGAGRLMSRAEAKKAVSLSDFQKSMVGIFSTTVNAHTLDESPMAYKNMVDIISNIFPTVEIMSVIKPVYNFKADN